MYTEPRYDRWTIPIAPLQFGKYSKSYLTIWNRIPDVTLAYGTSPIAILNK